MTENNRAIMNLHNLLDMIAGKFSSAEAELKNSILAIYWILFNPEHPTFLNSQIEIILI